MPWSQNNGNNQGPNKGPWGNGNKNNQTPPDLEEFFRIAQEKIRDTLNGGPSNPNGGAPNNTRMYALLAAGALLVWGLSGFYRVEQDEAGVEMVFGQVTRIRPPGLNYVVPAPFGRVLTPKVTTAYLTEIGSGTGTGNEFRRAQQQGNEESQMLTGDENIINVDFSVNWLVKTEGNGVVDYLFNFRNPKGTVKAVAESAMREVVGRSKFSNIITDGGDKIQLEVQELMQKTLDSYKAGVLVKSVKIQGANPPAQVIDSVRDVQAARADRERLQNEAETYRNRMVPEARGEAEKIRQGADAYRQKVVNDAKGQADRFSQVLEEYKKAPNITKERLYIETMEKVLTNSDKTLVDGGAGVGDVVPYLPLDSARRPQPSATQTNRVGGQ